MAHVPIRRCCGCNRRAPKGELLRFRIDAGGGLAWDDTGRGNGRGAYACRRRECVEKALKKGAFAKTLRARFPAVDVSGLLDRMKTLLDGSEGMGGVAVHD